MIIVTKNSTNFFSVSLNGPLAQTFVNGYFIVEWVADQTGETIYMIPTSTQELSWRQTTFLFDEGIDDPINGSVILTGTNRHWNYNIWKCPYGTEPTSAPFTVPAGSTLLEIGRVWVEGTNNAPINDIYK